MAAGQGKGSLKKLGKFIQGFLGVPEQYRTWKGALIWFAGGSYETQKQVLKTGDDALAKSVQNAQAETVQLGNTTWRQYKTSSGLWLQGPQSQTTGLSATAQSAYFKTPTGLRVQGSKEGARVVFKRAPLRVFARSARAMQPFATIGAGIAVPFWLVSLPFKAGDGLFDYTRNRLV